MQDMGSIMRQAQKMQTEIASVQEAFRSTQIEASAGGGAVVAVVDGAQKLVELTIDAEVFAEGDAGLLADMVIGAVNQAMKLSQEMLDAEIEKVTGPVDLAGVLS